MKKLKPFLDRVTCFLTAQNFLVSHIRDSNSPVDLIAIRGGIAFAYRCKAHGKIYEAEKQKIRGFAKKFKLEAYIVKEAYGREIVFHRV